MDQDNQVLRQKLEKMAREGGARLFGVADLRPARDYLADIYGPDLIHLERGVVMAIPFPVGVINQLQDAPTHTYLYYYKIVNTSLDDLALKVALFLQDEGYEAFPIPASQRVTEDRLAGIFSHRLAANLAGLGWIGKNSCLVTSEFGPRVRLVTVLTNAPLPVDKPVKDRCGSCQACVEACPASAITGKEFKTEEPLSVRFNAKECDNYFDKVRVSFGKRICGKCLASCPWGASTNKRRIK